MGKVLIFFEKTCLILCRFLRIIRVLESELLKKYTEQDVKYMKIAIQEFIDYLHNEKNTSLNTEISYKRDLKKLEEFLTEQGV